MWQMGKLVGFQCARIGVRNVLSKLALHFMQVSTVKRCFFGKKKINKTKKKTWQQL